MIVNKKESNTFNQNILNQIGNTDISEIGDGTLTGAVTELNNYIDEMFISKTFQQKHLAETGKAYYVDFDVALDGYTPIAISAFTTGNSTVVVYGTYLDSSTNIARLGVYAVSGAEAYRTITVLYKKN